MGLPLQVTNCRPCYFCENEILHLFFTDSHCPDTVHVQNKLLDTISSCLRMLIALSPDLVALVTDDIVDKDAFEQLLQIGFSTPAFEQVSLAKTSRE